MVVCVTLNNRVVGDICEAAGNKSAEGVVVGVEVRTEEFGDEVWFLVRGRTEVLGGGRVGGVDSCKAVALVHAVGRQRAFLGRKQGLFFRFQGFGEVFEQWFKRGIEGHMEKDDKD